MLEEDIIRAKEVGASKEDVLALMHSTGQQNLVESVWGDSVPENTDEELLASLEEYAVNDTSEYSLDSLEQYAVSVEPAITGSDMSEEDLIRELDQYEITVPVDRESRTDPSDVEQYLKDRGIAPLVSTEPTRFTERPMAGDVGGVEGESGLLMTGLDYLNRPGAAIRGAVAGALDEDGSVLEGAKSGITGESNVLMGDLIYDSLEDNYLEYKEGNTDNLVGRLVDINPEVVMPAVSTVAGLIGDVLLDPLTYTGAGLARKGATAVAADAIRRDGGKVTIQALVDKGITDPKMLEYGLRLGEGPVGLRNTALKRVAEGQTKIVVAGVPLPEAVSSALAKTAGAVVDAVANNKTMHDTWQLFSTKYKLPEDLEGFAELERRFKDVLAMATVHEVTKTGTPMSREIVSLSKELKIPKKELETFITEAVERGGVSGVRLGMMDQDTVQTLAKHKEVRDVVDNISKVNSEQLAKEVSAGVRIADFSKSTDETINLLRASIESAEAKGQRLAYNPLGKGKGLKSVTALKKDLAKLETKALEEDKLHYIMHAMTPEARSAMYEAGFLTKATTKTGNAIDPDHASKLARKSWWRDRTVAEINEAAKAGELPGKLKDKVFPNGFFYEDPAVIQTIRGIRHRKSMAAVDLLSTTTARFGEDIEGLRVKHGLSASASADDVLEAAGLDGYRQLGTARLQELTNGNVFPAAIAERLENHYEKMFDLEQTNLFLKTFDSVQSWWKAFTLGIFPSYHIRNTAGNMWNNFVTSERNMLNPIEHKKHVQTYFSAGAVTKGKEGFITTDSGERISYQQIRDWMDELGVHNRGMISTEVEQAIESQIKGGVWTGNPVSLFGLLSREGKLIHKGHQVGTAVENNARVAKFIEELQLGKDHVAAAEAVKRALFDYSDLTSFEQNFMRRLLPFYTWSRKNIPLQVAEMVKHPGRYMAVDHLRQEIERNSEEEMSKQDTSEYVLNQFFLDNYPTRLGFKEIELPSGDTKRVPMYFLLGGWLPAADVWKLAASPERLPLDLLSPIIKTPMELLMGKDLFLGMDMDIEAKTDFFGSGTVNEGTKKVLYNIRLLSTLDRLLTGLGVVEKSEKLVPTPETEMTASEVIAQAVTGARLYATDLDSQFVYRVKDLEQAMKELQNRYSKELKRGIEVDPEDIDADVQELIEQFTELYQKGKR